MSFLWNKDATLDERVLRYTAGEDHALDARLVRYDVAAVDRPRRNAARRETPDAQRICKRSAPRSPLWRMSTRGLWRIELADEDGQTALEKRLTAAHRRVRRPHPPRPFAERPGAGGAAALSARCHRGAARAALNAVAAASR
jgi:hypothetical protein